MKENIFNNSQAKHSKLSRILGKAGRILGWVIISLFALLFIIIILVRMPFAQKFITEKASTWFSEKTNMNLSIDRLFFTYTGNVFVEGLYMEDLKGDTLMYFHSLEAGILIRPLISGKIDISSITLKGLVADIHKSNEGEYNFQAILNAFSSGEVKEESESRILIWDRLIFGISESATRIPLKVYLQT
jgi:translocation and assembly module TamB